MRQGVQPDRIWAISFTNAATEELRTGIVDYCTTRAIPPLSAVAQVRVTTLHSLALTLLSRAGQLSYYPTRPRVLDEWEQRHIFDEELSRAIGAGITRCGELRSHFEAIWSTGAPPLPFLAPTAPISPAEEQAFNIFHRRATQVYSCLLPGEAVHRCVDGIKNGLISPVSLLAIEHLVVDEYQDLNLADVEFIDLLMSNGIRVFTCGDDDQSIYSFRYAHPAGIQGFLTRHPAAASHTLPTCFRCTTSVLAAANNLVATSTGSNRIPKNLVSAYSSSQPVVLGQVIGLRTSDGSVEADGLARSVKSLVVAGVRPESILVLLSNTRTQLAPLVAALASAQIPVDVPGELALAGSGGSRFAYALLRRALNADDYLAGRTLLGVQSGVGQNTCAQIAQICASNSLNFSDQLTPQRSAGLFAARQQKALTRVEGYLAQCTGWAEQDLLATRRGTIDAVVANGTGTTGVAEWQQTAALLLPDMSLGEVLGLLGARSEREARALLEAAYARVGVPLPSALNPAGRVRLMTLHTSKGLSAQAVFIPGLEEELLPGPYRSRYPAQIEEAARLLYVGITRARALCVLSFADGRLVNGSFRRQTPSRFLQGLGVGFRGAAALSATEVSQSISDIAAL